MNWVLSSIIAMLVMSGYSLLIPFMLKNYNVPGFTTVTLWMIGASAGLILLKGSFSFTVGAAAPNGRDGVVVLIGFVFGTIMNFTITDAIISSPNPAYPMTILNASAGVVMFLVRWLTCFQQVFPEATVNIRGIAGFLLVMLGRTLFQLL